MKIGLGRILQAGRGAADAVMSKSNQEAIMDDYEAWATAKRCDGGMNFKDKTKIPISYIQKYMKHYFKGGLGSWRKG